MFERRGKSAYSAFRKGQISFQVIKKLHATKCAYYMQASRIEIHELMQQTKMNIITGY